MYRSIFQISIALVILDKAIAGTLRPNRQVNHEVNSDQDRQQAETGLASAAIASGKYFQYAHIPNHNHYEFGHKKGNDHHFNERHEKAQPHDGHFKTKVRWGDKHGGYGEHYWDYNHDGHDGHGGEESQDDPQYAKYEEEESQHNPQVQIAPKKIEQPKYQQYLGRNRRQPAENPRPKNSRSFEEISEEAQDSRNKRQPKNENYATFPEFTGSEILENAGSDSKDFPRGKRHPNLESDDVEFIDSRARSLVESGRAEKHGGNYRRLPGLERAKRGPNVEYSDFVYEPETGKMINQKTGDVFELTLIK